MAISRSDEPGAGLSALRHGAHEFLPKSALTTELLERTFRHGLTRLQLEQQLRDQARTDALSGCANGVLFRERLEQTVARSARRDGAFSVLFVDLDGFKAVNDSLGHAAGDAVIVEVAKRLSLHVRGYDTVGRLGGDEFAVLLEDFGGKQVGALGRRLISALNVPIRTCAGVAQVGASVGVAQYPAAAKDAAGLLAAADQAMYQAKKRGKNRLAFFPPYAEVQARNRQEFRQQVQDALDKRAFRLYFQPQIDLKSGGLWGFEALFALGGWCWPSDSTSRVHAHVVRV